MAEETWEQDSTEEKEFEDEVSEAAEYSPKSDFSKAQIVYEQVGRCCSLRSEEMRPGYSTHITDKIGNIKMIHIPDARKKFIGAVDALMNVLSPEIKRLRKPEEDEEDYIAEINNEKENIKKKYIYIEKIISIKNGEYILAPSGRKYLPEVGDILTAGMKVISKGIMGENKVEGIWDSKVNAYYNELLGLYDILFSDLNCLIDELNYFKQTMSF